jgi:MazG family protein
MVHKRTRNDTTLNDTTPGFAEMSTYETSIDKLKDVMQRLRNPEHGCPWDLEQTFQTIAPHTIEEAYEVADAIENGDMDDIKDELGDLLFQVIFYAQMGSESGDFTFDDIAEHAAEKMISRHPHVFGDNDNEKNAATSDDVMQIWDARKDAEKGLDQDMQSKSVMDDVALGLPALTRAEKLQKRAARKGFQWPNMAPVLDKLNEEIEELRQAQNNNSDREELESEFGDILFVMVNLARQLDIDSENALRKTNDKFARRFKEVEASFEKENKNMNALDLDELVARWVNIKKGSA